LRQSPDWQTSRQRAAGRAKPPIGTKRRAAHRHIPPELVSQTFRLQPVRRRSKQRFSTASNFC
jgi:hypothetical protein